MEMGGVGCRLLQNIQDGPSIIKFSRPAEVCLRAKAERAARCLRRGLQAKLASSSAPRSFGRLHARLSRGLALCGHYATAALSAWARKLSAVGSNLECLGTFNSIPLENNYEWEGGGSSVVTFAFHPIDVSSLYSGIRRLLLRIRALF